jgi:uncharacterized membrane protein YhaH (DUF805 family)
LRRVGWGGVRVLCDVVRYGLHRGRRIMSDFVDSLQNRYAEFSGRARRREYWMFVLFSVLTYLVACMAGMLVDVVLNTEGIIMALALVGVWLGLIVPSIAVAIRRLHDTGHSGWMFLLAFVPVVSLVLLVFYCIDSQPGSNQYGPNPKGIPA